MNPKIIFLAIIICYILFAGCVNSPNPRSTDNPSLYMNNSSTPPLSQKIPEVLNNSGVPEPIQTQESTNTSFLWQPENKHPWPMFHGGYNHNGYSNVSGPTNATLKWKFYSGNIKGESPNSIAISNNGTIVFAGSGKVFALDEQGKEKWSKNYKNSQGPAIAYDSTTYFVSEDSVIALSENGTEKWQFKTNGKTIFGPTIGPDGTVYQGSWDAYLYAITQNGTLKWKYRVKGPISYPVSIDNIGTIYAGGGDAHAGPDGNIYALNEKGELKWAYDTKTLRVGSPAIGFNGLAYFPASPFLFALNSTGNLQWKKGSASPGGEIAGIISPAIAADGTLYIGTSQGILYAINTTSQEIKWSFKTGSDKNQVDFYGLPSFLVVDKDATVYAGSVDGNMYSVDKNGKLKWKYSTKGRITEAAPALGPDGTLYFGSEDGYLYAIGESK